MRIRTNPVVISYQGKVCKCKKGKKNYARKYGRALVACFLEKEVDDKHKEEGYDEVRKYQVDERWSKEVKDKSVEILRKGSVKKHYISEKHFSRCQLPGYIQFMPKIDQNIGPFPPTPKR